MVRYFTFLLLGVTSACCIAKTSVVMNNTLKAQEIKSAKIVYIGEVNGTKVAELMAGIDDINASYPAVKEISLYINSFGGDMEAGYMGGQAVRGVKDSYKNHQCRNDGFGGYPDLLLRGAKGNITQRDIFNPSCSESKHSEQLSEKK
ncbi:hypothetical protein [Pantoea sp. 1B4]|uniref:hypothetical protein n=1 Tax=Pantoea sp. 1B4 TaxID=2804760 RepID=UPI002D7E9F8B|nr:hypothetical protein [Pantoea sp. 1B4]